MMIKQSNTFVTRSAMFAATMHLSETIRTPSKVSSGFCGRRRRALIWHNVVTSSCSPGQRKNNKGVHKINNIEDDHQMQWKRGSKENRKSQCEKTERDPRTNLQRMKRLLKPIHSHFRTVKNLTKVVVVITAKRPTMWVILTFWLGHCVALLIHQLFRNHHYKIPVPLDSFFHY